MARKPKRRRNVSASLVAAATVIATLLLTSAPSAAGFGFITKWGRQGTGPGQLSHPRGIATDPAGNVYVTDMTGGSKRVLQKFTARGDFVVQIGGGPAAAPAARK